MNIALTGTSGFIGAAIARHATRAGHRVSGLVRETSRTEHLEGVVDRLVRGTQDDARARTELLEGADVVIHNSFDWSVLRSGDLEGHLRSNLLGSLELLRDAGDRPFVYLSSVAVHHHIDPTWNNVIDDRHPARPGSAYGALKAAVEAHMWAANAERGQAVVALRPCAVYGIDPDRSRSIGWPIIDSIREERRYVRKGGGKFVHVEDVAAATLAAVSNPGNSPAIHHLVDCYARWGDWGVMTAELLGVEAEIDLDSPEQSLNRFETAGVREALGVAMDRGHEGIRDHIRAMIELKASDAGATD